MPPPAARRRRIQWLVIALMALSAAPMLELALPLDAYQPVLSEAIRTALFATSNGTMLLLSFWVGLGRQSIFRRLLGGVMGAAYISVWPGLLMEISFASLPAEITYPWEEHASSALMNLAVVAGFGAAFMALRRWWKLDPTPSPSAAVAGKTQFSLLAILFVMAGSAVVMGGVRASRNTLNEMEETTATTIVVVLTIYFANAVGAAFAALRPSAVRRHCLTAFGTSLLLGVAISLATGEDQYGAGLAGGALLGAVPATIMMLSLLVVRSTGYRLVRKSASLIHSDERRNEATTQPAANVV